MSGRHWTLADAGVAVCGVRWHASGLADVVVQEAGSAACVLHALSLSLRQRRAWRRGHRGRQGWQAVLESRACRGTPAGVMQTMMQFWGCSSRAGRRRTGSAPGRRERERW